MNWIIENKEASIAVLFALLGLAEIVVRLTPTEKDDSILKKIKALLLLLFPNNKKGGGIFK